MLVWTVDEKQTWPGCKHCVFVSVHKKGASVAMRLCVHVYVCMHVCVRVCGPAAATRRLMCWGSSPFDKLSPGFSCSPASLCWKQCVGTGPPASPLSPRSPAKNHTHEHTVNLMISVEFHHKTFTIISFLTFILKKINHHSRSTHLFISVIQNFWPHHTVFFSRCSGSVELYAFKLSINLIDVDVKK